MTNKKDGNYVSELKKVLTKGETIIHEYHIGLYSILATNKRLVVGEKFPKNLYDITYDDIELVEYYTFIKWKEFFIGLGAIIASIFVFVIYSHIKNALIQLVPAVTGVFEGSGGIILTIYVIICLAALFFGLYQIGVFAFSFMGRFRILIYEQMPIEMMCKLTPELEQLIKFLDEKEKSSKSKKKKNEA